LTSEEEEETRTFKCRHCSGTVSYSATEHVLTCPYCGRAQDLDAEEVGEAAAEFEFTLETMERAQYGWGRSGGSCCANPAARSWPSCRTH
jgi:hypothetical protein